MPTDHKREGKMSQCPKCGCNKSSEAVVWNKKLYNTCSHCTCGWTDWQQEIIEQQEQEIARLKDAGSKAFNEVEQALGKVLGYPWYKDDQKNFPGATEADGVCVGDHVAQSIAMEAAHKIERLREGLRRLQYHLTPAKDESEIPDYPYDEEVCIACDQKQTAGCHPTCWLAALLKEQP